MATKSYTDLPQSQRLAKILNHESADMVYVHTIDLEGDEHYDIDFRNNQPLFEDDICAWSLAVLLNALPDRVTIDGHRWFLSLGKKRISYLGCMTYDGQLHISVESDNLIDACYEMILKLHEQKVL